MKSVLSCSTCQFHKPIHLSNALTASPQFLSPPPPVIHHSPTAAPTTYTIEIAFLKVSVKPVAFLCPHPESLLVFNTVDFCSSGNPSFGLSATSLSPLPLDRHH